jgi:hypothetical protein
LKGSIRKLEAIGLVAVLFAVMFAAVPGSVSAEETSDETVDQLPDWIVEGTGTSFEIIGSEFQNVVLTSSEEVTVHLESIPDAVNFFIESDSALTATDITMSGLKSDTKYTMFQDGESVYDFQTDSEGAFTYQQSLSKHSIMIFEGEISSATSTESFSSTFAGGSGTPEDPYQISNVIELQNIKLDISAHYILINNIDASATSTWNGGAGFEPIGTRYPNWFEGSLDGNGYKITDLYINRPSGFYIGMFGVIRNSEIKNLDLEDFYVDGLYMVGSIVGANFMSSVSNCHASSNLIGYRYAGNLVGGNLRGTISNSHSTGSVTGTSGSSHVYAGGLVGLNEGSIFDSYSTASVSGTRYLGGLTGQNRVSSYISNSHATGNVNGDHYIGGFVGHTYTGTIWDSYATGTATGSTYVGGFVGYQSGGSILNSHATGSVSGGKYIGGFSGYNYRSSISYSFATGSVSGLNTCIGGLVGKNAYYASISNSYSTGNVVGEGHTVGGLAGLNDNWISNSYSTGTVTCENEWVGGLIGYNERPVINSYWNTDVNIEAMKGVGDPHSNPTGVHGKTTVEMKKQVTYEGWDFTDIWRIQEDISYPYLWWENDPPVADAGSDRIVIIGEIFTFDGSGSTDSDGTIVSYDWDFGDTNTGTGVSPAHSYDTAGIFTATLSVTDDGGASDSDSVTITVITPEQATLNLITEVELIGLEDGPENSLVSKLDNAIKSITNDRPSAFGQLDAFINECEAQRGKTLTAVQADALIAEAQKIIDSLS